MHYRVPQHLACISNRVGEHLLLLKPQDASNLMWALAKLHFKPNRRLLEELPVAIVDRLSEFKPQVCLDKGSAALWYLTMHWLHWHCSQCLCPQVVQCMLWLTVSAVTAFR